MKKLNYRTPHKLKADRHPYEDVDYVIYDPETGAIRQVGSCPYVGFERMLERGDPVIEARVDDPDEHIVDLDAKRVIRKPKRKAMRSDAVDERAVEAHRLSQETMAVRHFMHAFLADYRDPAKAASLTPALRSFVESFKHLVED